MLRALLRLLFSLLVVGVLLVIGLYLWTGSLGFLQNVSFLRNLDVPALPRPDVSAERGAAGNPVDLNDSTVQLTWRNDEILYNGTVIDEAAFAELLAEVRANEGKVTITKSSDVTVQAADRWRRLLDEAGVRYEVIPHE
jgi:hypothetical protein